MSEDEVLISMGIKDPHHPSETVNAVINLQEIRNDDSVEIEEIKDRIIDPTREMLLRNSVLKGKIHAKPTSISSHGTHSVRNAGSHATASTCTTYAINTCTADADARRCFSSSGK